MILGTSKRGHGGQCTLALRRLKIAGKGQQGLRFRPRGGTSAGAIGPR
jgi:hypothetical protein